MMFYSCCCVKGREEDASVVSAWKTRTVSTSQVNQYLQFCSHWFVFLCVSYLQKSCCVHMLIRRLKNWGMWVHVSRPSKSAKEAAVGLQQDTQLEKESLVTSVLTFGSQLGNGILEPSCHSEQVVHPNLSHSLVFLTQEASGCHHCRDLRDLRRRQRHRECRCQGRCRTWPRRHGQWGAMLLGWLGRDIDAELWLSQPHANSWSPSFSHGLGFRVNATQ